MSLRGIDAQIMLARTVEYQRPAAAEQQRAALMSDIRGTEGDMRAQRKTERVSAPEESERAALRPDGGGGGRGAYSPGGGRRGAGVPEDGELAELTEPTDDGRVIDITV
ncbi:MAG: hypothetical protein LBD49_06370 [Oscillospiraceae bacterium]|jgi:hypothetical protein|nr:hypothetical protein [Oscillospiraceae bacterium]